MRRIVISAILVLAVGLMFLSSEPAGAAPMGTAYTYQGRLLDANDTADGWYDFEIRLFDDPCTGTQQGGIVAIDNLDVIDGHFTIELDFGNNIFTGEARWLEIAVRPGASIDGNDFVTLLPRQETTPTPYAIYAQTAEDANTIDGLESGDFAIRLHAHRGEDITAGTVGTDFYSAIQDLFAEGYLNNGSGDLAQNNGTLQTNLNADRLDGQHESAFFRVAQNETVTGRPSFNGGISGSIPPFYVDSSFRVVNLNADLLDGSHGSNFFNLIENEVVLGIPAFNGGVSGSTAPFFVDSTTKVTNLNADYLDGYSEDSFFRLSQNEAVTGRPFFNGGTSGSTPPFFVDSTLTVANLSSDLLDGLHSTAFATSVHNHDASYVNVTGDTMTASLNVSSNPAAYAVQGIGDNGPTNGYLGVQGINSYEGVTSTYWSGREIGVAGISTGGTTTDNYGVLGHASQAGVRGEYSGDPNNYGELGRSGGYGLYARGTGYAGYFLGKVYAIDSSNDSFSKTIYGRASSTGTGQQIAGVYGQTDSTATINSGAGVWGYASSSTGSSSGTRGEAAGSSGKGVYARASHTSGTNYALYASTASSNGYAGYFSGGKNYFSGDVGIGTTTPIYKLEVKGTMGTSADASGKLRVGRYSAALPQSYISAMGPAEQMRLQIGDSTKMTITSSGNVGIGTTSPVSKLDINGTTRTNVLVIDGGADLAEPFSISDSRQIPKGALVVIDEKNPGQLKLSDRAYDNCVAGVVSGAGGLNAGLTLSQKGIADGGVNVALTGRVYAMADTCNGAIKPGDMLTTSGTPGHAMKATDRERSYGTVIGKAMSSLEEGKGLVLVLVNLQ